MVESEFLHCGSTNTEPGAAATGFNLGYIGYAMTSEFELGFVVIGVGQ
jgi:hypothetical protein